MLFILILYLVYILDWVIILDYILSQNMFIFWLSSNSKLGHYFGVSSYFG